MTQAVEVVLANNAAFNDRDVEAMLALYAPDAVVVDRRQHGLGQFNGHAELRPYYSSIFNAVEALNEDIRVLAERDETVVAHCETWARLPNDETGAGLTTPYGLLVQVRDGRIQRLEVFNDGADALAESGLRNQVE
jgi:ketosteroid isomerase-like protein